MKTNQPKKKIDKLDCGCKKGKCTCDPMRHWPPVCCKECPFIHQPTPAQEAWEKELFGYNERGIVQYDEGQGGYRVQRAYCQNCKQSVQGSKAREWMFGHKDCPSPNGEYLRNDVTPEKIRKVVAHQRKELLDEVRKLCVDEFNNFTSADAERIYDKLDEMEGK